MLVAFSEVFHIHPWMIDDLTPGELAVYKQRLKAIAEVEAARGQ
jgi:hypothetical protein